MNMFKWWLLLGLSVVLCFPFSVSAQDTPPPSPSDLFEAFESFSYEVRYGLLRLGVISISEIKDTTYQGKDAFYFLTTMKTNPRLLFVGNREEHFSSIYTVTDGVLHGLEYRKDDVDSNKPDEFAFFSDLSTNTLKMMEEQQFTDSTALREKVLLGPEIFHFGRLFAGKDTTLYWPFNVLIDPDTVYMAYSSTPEPRYVKAFSTEVPSYKIEGNAPFEGPFGFSGKFKGWFGTDSLRIPLESHAKVWIGNVKVYLTEYKRR